MRPETIPRPMLNPKVSAIVSPCKSIQAQIASQDTFPELVGPRLVGTSGEQQSLVAVLWLWLWWLPWEPWQGRWPRWKGRVEVQARSNFLPLLRPRLRLRLPLREAESQAPSPSPSLSSSDGGKLAAVEPSASAAFPARLPTRPPTGPTSPWPCGARRRAGVRIRCSATSAAPMRRTHRSWPSKPNLRTSNTTIINSNNNNSDNDINNNIRIIPDRGPCGACPSGIGNKNRVQYHSPPQSTTDATHLLRPAGAGAGPLVALALEMAQQARRGDLIIQGAALANSLLEKFGLTLSRELLVL